MLPFWTTPDLLGGMWALLQDAQAVPSWPATGRRARHRLAPATEPVAVFAGSLGSEIKLLTTS